MCLGFMYAGTRDGTLVLTLAQPALPTDSCSQLQGLILLRVLSLFTMCSSSFPYVEMGPAIYGTDAKVDNFHQVAPEHSRDLCLSPGGPHPTSEV